MNKAKKIVSDIKRSWEHFVTKFLSDQCEQNEKNHFKYWKLNFWLIQTSFSEKSQLVSWGPRATTCPLDVSHFFDNEKWCGWLNDVFGHTLCPLGSVMSVRPSVRLSVLQVLMLPAIGFLSFLAWSQGLWSYFEWRSLVFEKKCWGPNLGKKGPKRAQNEVFCDFFDYISSEFACIAYGNRKRRW